VDGLTTFRVEEWGRRVVAMWRRIDSGDGDEACNVIKVVPIALK
jgi:hypothetical protein